jgi:outer membrane protein insertion porin family
MTTSAAPTVWRVARLAAAIACLALTASPAALAAASEGSEELMAAARKTPHKGTAIARIRIEGNQRIEPETIGSYLLLQPGDPWDDRVIDQSLKALFATGLFADVSLSRAGDTLVVRVIENPIINSIRFEGNSEVQVKALEGEMQLRPRVVYTPKRVENDVRRILDLYRRYGRFATTVEPKVNTLPDNRVDLVFAIEEGRFTGIGSIRFVGNHQFEAVVLRAVMRTKESRWYRSPQSYDPDRLTYDRELLRRFYLTRGYADIRVLSAVAELTPEHDAFMVTITVDEGEPYRFGRIDVDIKIKDLPPEAVLPLLTVYTGDRYNAEAVEKSISVLTDTLGNRGYAFVEIKPNINRKREGRTVDITFNVQEGPQVYVERIDIVGNVRTLDRVIRREFRLVEGDAFNAWQLTRSQDAIKKLDFFRKVELTTSPGSAADRTIISAEVEEQSTGSISAGAGYALGKGLLASFALEERNFLGRGQAVIANAEFSSEGTETELSFTDPYVADRPIRGKWGVAFSTGASYDWRTLIAGFKLTMWVGVLVFEIPVVLLLLLQGAYYTSLWSHDQSRCRRQFRRTMEACKATIFLQVSYVIVANVIQALNLGITRLVDV